jgi:hypothetical protein
LSARLNAYTDTDAAISRVGSAARFRRFAGVSHVVEDDMVLILRFP